ncbi:MAG: hypothetical protein QOH30_622 [Baekduia sp.]|jgi:hypothetical protein|nr:hypothetical protein [Baekduia sp.]MDX6732510.1 hypothetical protein [Baekduia sp.]
MSLSTKFRHGTMGAAALAALGLGGSAIAGAATNGATTTTPAASPSAAAPSGAPAGARPDRSKPGGHVGADGKTEAALSSDVAAKVTAAAKAKVAGGTVLRVETDVDHGSPYEAHVQKSDGTEVEVLVDSGFTVTAVNTMGHP